MNCHSFQHRLYEYLDGSLSPGAQAAAEKHLAGCAACRQVLQAERRVADGLSEYFRRTTDALQLPPEVQGRILGALGDERGARTEEPGKRFWWGRLAWPLGVAASALLLLTGVWLYVRVPSPRTGPAPAAAAAAEVSIQLSYVVPSYTFRREGGFVIDTLTYQTNVVNERFPAASASLE